MEAPSTPKLPARERSGRARALERSGRARAPKARARRVLRDRACACGGSSADESRGEDAVGSVSVRVSAEVRLRGLEAGWKIGPNGLAVELGMDLQERLHDLVRLFGLQGAD